MTIAMRASMIRKRHYTSQTILRAATLVTLGCGIMALAGPAQGATEATPAPTAQERAELDKHPVYTGNIEVLASNEGSGLLAFLDENAGKTVFLESSMLRYWPLPEGTTAKDSGVKVPPTDRFANPVFKNCWSAADIAYQGVLESGEAGFPLPRDQADIEAGCAMRIKVEMIDGDASGNMLRVNGSDKMEIFFVGFFDVKKESLEGGKTLYRLSEVSQPEETAAVFYKHATKKGRTVRQLWTADAKQATGKAE